MHWLTICIISGQSALMLASFSMLISHALLSTNSFFLVDAISRRFKTRLITEISGLNFLCPKLFILTLINTLVFLGFPGSIMFVSEILFFSFFFWLISSTLFSLYIFFVSSWSNFFFQKLNECIIWSFYTFIEKATCWFNFKRGFSLWRVNFFNVLIRINLSILFFNNLYTVFKLELYGNLLFVIKNIRA